MRARIRQSIDWVGNPMWIVETKSWWLPWWRKRDWSTIKSKAEMIAKILSKPEIEEVTK